MLGKNLLIIAKRFTFPLSFFRISVSGLWKYRFAIFTLGATSVILLILASQELETSTFNAGLTGRYQFFAINIPKDANIAGERIPIEDYDVYERFDRELRIQIMYQGYSSVLIKRTRRWFPVLEPILKRNNIPHDFLYVAAVESMFENRQSNKGAGGMWQLMPAAATKFGLVINGEIDERYHPEKATLAACKYIKFLSKEFGSWSSALAAYNMGNGALSRSLKNQKMDNYFDLNLNRESQRYVFKVAAVKEIIERGSNYGVFVNAKSRYYPIAVRKVKIKKSIPNLAEWALKEKVNIAIVKLQNPWIRGNSLTISNGNTYFIEIPKDLSQYDNLRTLEALELDQDSVPKQDSVTIDELPRTINKPIASAEASPKTPELAKEANPTTANAELDEVGFHTVAKGDNLGSIAQKHNTTVAQLIKINKLKKRALLHIGQRLRVQ